MYIDDDWHTCHFCGEAVNKEGYSSGGIRHFLSDCRPDLVEHEISSLCTWSYRRLPLIMHDGSILEPIPEEFTCYAYEERFTLEWTKEHKHFYPDGPM